MNSANPDRPRNLILAAIIALIVLLGVGAGGWLLWAAVRDIPPPDTTDLIPERIELPPEQNACTAFLSATNSFHWPTNASWVVDDLDGKAADDAAIRDLIARNTETLQAIRRGLECPRCITPEVTGFDTPVPYLSLWRNMGRVMALKAKQDRRAGRYVEAADTCVSLLQFGDIIQKDAGSILHYLVGVAVLELGLAQVRDLARDQGTPAGERARVLEALARLGPFDPGLIHAIKGEYRVTVNTIDQMADGRLGWETFNKLCDGEPLDGLKGKPIPGYFFQPNKTKLIFANLYRGMIKDAPRIYADMSRYDMEADLNDSKDKLLTRPNGVGKILCALLLPAVDSFLERKCRVECGVAATRLVVACTAYRKKEGRLPDDLQALVPAYLAAVPRDPYDGKGFRYLPASGLLYSVGKDLKDSGGSSRTPGGDAAAAPATQRWKAEDVVFEIGAGP